MRASLQDISIFQSSPDESDVHPGLGAQRDPDSRDISATQASKVLRPYLPVSKLLMSKIILSRFPDEPLCCLDHTSLLSAMSVVLESLDFRVL